MNDIKNFLKRMIDEGGFIARGVYTDSIHVWQSNSKHSQSMVDMRLFDEMRRAGYIQQDRTGRYYPTDKGRKLVTPWYKRMLG